MSHSKRTDETEAFHTRIGKNMRIQRKLLGMTQEELGAKLNPPRAFQQIQKYETGANRMDSHTFFNVCQVLCLTPARMLTGTGVQIIGADRPPVWEAKLDKLAQIEAIINGAAPKP